MAGGEERSHTHEDNRRPSFSDLEFRYLGCRVKDAIGIVWISCDDEFGKAVEESYPASLCMYLQFSKDLQSSEVQCVFIASLVF